MLCEVDGSKHKLHSSNHGVMNGYTGFVASPINDNYAYIPLEDVACEKTQLIQKNIIGHGWDLFPINLVFQRARHAIHALIEVFRGLTLLWESGSVAGLYDLRRDGGRNIWRGSGGGCGHAGETGGEGVRKKKRDFSSLWAKARGILVIFHISGFIKGKIESSSVETWVSNVLT